MLKRILIVNTCSSGDNKSARSIKSLLKKVSSKIVSYKSINSIEDLSKYSGIILSGQPLDEKSITKKV